MSTGLTNLVKNQHMQTPHKKFVSEIRESKKEVHNFLDEFNCLTLKILCKTAMGVDVGNGNSGTGFTDRISVLPSLH